MDFLPTEYNFLSPESIIFHKFNGNSIFMLYRSYIYETQKKDGWVEVTVIQKTFFLSADRWSRKELLMSDVGELFKSWANHTSKIFVCKWKEHLWQPSFDLRGHHTDLHENVSTGIWPYINKSLRVLKKRFDLISIFCRSPSLFSTISASSYA